jgi:hypothetical protein
MFRSGWLSPSLQPDSALALSRRAKGIPRGSYANYPPRQLDPKATLPGAKLSPLKTWSHIIYEPLGPTSWHLPTCVVLVSRGVRA